MRRPNGNRSRTCVLMLAALGVVAMLALPGIATAKDSNRDRIPDRWEKRHNLSLKVKQTSRDQDRDHLRNRAEFMAGNDPRDRDSDDDGVMDGDENAGTIESFDPETGRLAINLYGGDTVSGLVTDETRIRCGDDCRRHHDGEHHNGGRGDDDSGASASHRDEDEDRSGPGENSGPGSGSSGHDDGDDDSPRPDGTPSGAGGEGDEHDSDCTTTALVAGAVVDEAELELERGVATFEEIELEDSGS